ncbi:flavodoxin [Halobacillus sp. ACCC02827]|uniref:flavodoxin n=1 Tax=Halobacillus sp. ACCC02827 TaxID=3052090 RepID=UPI002570C867|nr:flavodoxin [Halobacillus sp. ACCC02827]WJE14796.1 flavodoxin [Halobacillus sp. ACCC02827]
MARILICYASMSGNTEEIADIIHSHLKNDYEVIMKEVEETEITELRDFDCVLIGSYTWNDGDLPYEVEDFYEELSENDLREVHGAVFGSGDRIYPQFCEAVHLLQAQLKANGAAIIQDGLEIEMTPDSEEDVNKCKVFAERVSHYLMKVGV